MPFEVTFCPGGQAGSRTFCFVDEEATLVVCCEPDRVAIVPPADPAEWPDFRRFLEDLARAAAELAEWVGQGSGQANVPVAAGLNREV
ncbi:hypothetical protein [Saccharomonospora azurea]|uniref:hypothetical protein n=1 Tax=Saccharomonospora azurea TaxID=40988 RepID=UPI00240A0CAE|nr:hypothetical protein [Saccharomonospora azurea]